MKHISTVAMKRPLLEVFVDGIIHHLKDLVEYAVIRFQVTPEQRSISYETRNSSVFEARVGSALADLHKRGLLAKTGDDLGLRSQDGRYWITEAGRAALAAGETFGAEKCKDTKVHTKKGRRSKVQKTEEVAVTPAVEAPVVAAAEEPVVVLKTVPLTSTQSFRERVSEVSGEAARRARQTTRKMLDEMSDSEFRLTILAALEGRDCGAFRSILDPDKAAALIAEWASN